MTTATTALADIRRVLLNEELQVRVEFGVAWGASGTLQTAQVYARPRVTEGNSKGWKKVGPFITTPENTRTALLSFLTDLVEEVAPLPEPGTEAYRIATMPISDYAAERASLLGPKT